jgi:hypothetical protein
MRAVRSLHGLPKVSDILLGISSCFVSLALSVLTTHGPKQGVFGLFFGFTAV